jgi:hypothetical protein
MRMLVFATILLLLGGASAQQVSSDWLIVPGERIGPITESTSEATLQALFGAENTESIDVDIGEGFSEPGTVVYPNDASRRLEVVWLDGSRTAPKEVRLTGQSSKWKTAEGISLGSTLKELERLNGFPFRLTGFAFDYSGTITDCGRGRLTMLGCHDVDGAFQGRQIILRLSPSAEARALPEYRQVIGDRVFSSGHPAMQALNPSVYQIIVLFGGRLALRPE